MQSQTPTPASTPRPATLLTQKMVHLQRYEQALQQLGGSWENLALLAQLSGTGTDMQQTRLAFDQVTANVLDQLATETLDKALIHLASKAQVSVDIVVRNLFERTADIGFLSTDEDICAFLQRHAAGTLTPEDSCALHQRFAEYVRKYSVYSDILLLDPHGQVVLQLDQNHPVATSQDPLIAQALSTHAPYVEVFRASDLAPGQPLALLYAYRVSASNGSPLGVLCLNFRFDNEMAGIFRHLVAPQDWALALLLDASGQVIASNDPYQIPLGAQLQMSEHQGWLLTRFAGRQYLAITRPTQGYQGYAGPGWVGHAMLPLEHAFDDDAAQAVSGVDPLVLQKVMRSPLLFSQALLEIPKQAAIIQSQLNQSVWNGNLWQKRQPGGASNAVGFSKTLLWEISKTGFKTQSVIEQTVCHLYQTVVSVMLENSRFFASLAVDIMDRNLYERANDCRWWALSPSFRRILAQPSCSDHDQAELTRILRHINSLYTVYTNLVLFDRQGKVVAVSNPAYHACVGRPLQTEWLSRTRSLGSSQDYVVSRFEPSALYADQPTYIYAAAIRALDTNSVVGGIGIVFDSTPQFSAMLTDALPRDPAGQPLAGSFTLYIDGELTILASTHPDFATGTPFKLHPALCKMAPGGTAFDIVSYDGRYYAVGARASSGYREFKGPDDAYRNPVTALIFIPLGSAADIDAIIAADATLRHNQFKPNEHQGAASARSEEYASFHVGSHWMGLPASQVVEALQTRQIKPVPDSSSLLAGIMQHQGKVLPVIALARAIGEPELPRATPERQVVVVERASDGSRLGLVVDALGEIPAIAPDQIKPMSGLFAQGQDSASAGIARVSSTDGRERLLTLVSADFLWRHVQQAQALLEAEQPLPQLQRLAA
jgi:chemotaxis signal transduction protein